VRARKTERLEQRYTLSLLSFVSKQMSARLFSLLQYKGLLTKTCTHTHTQRHALTSSRVNQCIVVSVISQGALLCPPWVSKVTKPVTKERISYFLAFFLLLFAFFFLLSFIAFNSYFPQSSMYICTICNILPYFVRNVCEAFAFASVLMTSLSGINDRQDYG